MPNPWLEIPLADYEGHMSSAAVQQLNALAELFAEVLQEKQPASVAIVGIAGGNGLNHINGRITSRIVGVDINPQYLDAVRSRYPDFPGMELHCFDLSEQKIEVSPVELVHAALIFEHAGLGRCLDNVLSLVARGGACSIVLQLPGNTGQEVGRSGFDSLQKLAADFSLISPVQLCEVLRDRGYQLDTEKQVALPAGKGFWIGLFTRLD